MEGYVTLFFLVFSVKLFHRRFRLYYVLRTNYHLSSVCVCVSVHVPAIRSSRIVIHVHYINEQCLFTHLFTQPFIYLTNIY